MSTQPPNIGAGASSRGHFKALFPAFYAVVFGFTLLSLFEHQLHSPPPILVEAVNGEKNRLFVSGCLLGLIAVLCIYLFVNYLRLELFEHRSNGDALTPSAVWNFVEFALRAAILAVVTVKILRWQFLPDILLFIALLSLLQLLWSLLLHFIFGEVLSQRSAWLHGVASVFSALSYWIASSPQLQLDLGMAIFAGTIIMIIVLGVQLLDLVRLIGREIWLKVVRYVISWS
jgi:hypothetical protein